MQSVQAQVGRLDDLAPVPRLGHDQIVELGRRELGHFVAEAADLWGLSMAPAKKNGVRRILLIGLKSLCTWQGGLAKVLGGYVVAVAHAEVLAIRARLAKARYRRQLLPPGLLSTSERGASVPGLGKAVETQRLFLERYVHIARAGG